MDMLCFFKLREKRKTMRHTDRRYLFLFVVFVLLGNFPTRAQSDEQEVIIKPVGNKVLFDTEEITAKAGSRLEVVFDNIATNPGMRHNFVLLDVRPDDETTIGQVGIGAVQAGEAKDYIPDHDAILAYTKIAGAGERVEVEFTVPPPGDYVYICSYLGHYVMMRGVLHSVK
jgi:azurin